MAGILGGTPVSTSQITSLQNKPHTTSGLTPDAFLTLDYLFQKNAIILNDTLTILKGSPFSIGGLDVNLPLPLIGFEYMAPDEVELLKYTYSEYPYINKTMITNAYIKENTRLSIIGLRPITYGGGAVNSVSTSVVGNYLTNELILSTLQAYSDKGGTFTLLTMWGQLNNLVLERLSGIRLESGPNQFQGQAYRFEFKRINFPKTKLQGLKNALSKMTLGIL